MIMITPVNLAITYLNIYIDAPMPLAGTSKGRVGVASQKIWGIKMVWKWF
jgi:hypothetical protein